MYSSSSKPSLEKAKSTATSNPEPNDSERECYINEKGCIPDEIIHALEEIHHDFADLKDFSRKKDVMLDQAYDLQRQFLDFRMEQSRSQGQSDRVLEWGAIDAKHGEKLGWRDSVRGWRESVKVWRDGVRDNTAFERHEFRSEVVKLVLIFAFVAGVLLPRRYAILFVGLMVLSVLAVGGA